MPPSAVSFHEEPESPGILYTTPPTNLQWAQGKKRSPSTQEWAPSSVGWAGAWAQQGSTAKGNWFQPNGQVFSFPHVYFPDGELP